ncbi:MAG: bacillithiol transferase BstA [Pyrinomonadaceae bacterium]|nr:bacillithiol transferase BstA [Pyrinomonadaceae bacterium]
MSEELKYPIGKFDKNIELTPELKQQFINDIAVLPEKLHEAVKDLSDERLDTPYRPEGWTVRQTVHHVADSHLNSMVRFKLALTEDAPTIRPYYEDRWAELKDSFLPIESSIKIIEGLHHRWATVLNTMSEADFQRKLVHPETGEWTLEKMLALYVWHGKHHTAHITSLRERNGW